jgi:hypothetical protein
MKKRAAFLFSISRSSPRCKWGWQQFIVGVAKRFWLGRKNLLHKGKFFLRICKAWELGAFQIVAIPILPDFTLL